MAHLRFFHPVVCPTRCPRMFFLESHTESVRALTILRDTCNWPLVIQAIKALVEDTLREEVLQATPELVWILEQFGLNSWGNAGRSGWHDACHRKDHEE